MKSKHSKWMEQEIMKPTEYAWKLKRDMKVQFQSDWLKFRTVSAKQMMKWEMMQKYESHKRKHDKIHDHDK